MDETMLEDPWRDPRVAAAQAWQPGNGAVYSPAAVRSALGRCAGVLGWGTRSAPFGAVVPAGARVLIKPNFVTHVNAGPWGVEPLLTHGELVRAVTEAVLASGAGTVTIGDAPIQSCDFAALLRATELDEWAESLAAAEPRFRGVEDFRRTRCVVEMGIRQAYEDLRPMDDFVLFDLASASLLEPITDAEPQFRVTQYDPRLMARTHAPDRHQYLVARSVVEADVVINLPKLKTHKKAGITCALKNLIGINGNKEYLPHHRVGGSGSGGDCYPGSSVSKRAMEFFLDRQNTAASAATARLYHGAVRAASYVARKREHSLDVEGSWSGNDTIWRTCLDLNRVLLYGTSDGRLADERQRRVLHVVDAIVAGQGDGPLSPRPLPLGLLFAGGNAAAVDLIGSTVLGYAPGSIPITREAFGSFRWPVADFTSEAVGLVGDFEGAAGLEAIAVRVRDAGGVEHPPGWRDAARPRQRAAS